MRRRRSPNSSSNVSTQRSLEPCEHRYLVKLAPALQGSNSKSGHLLRTQHPKLPLRKRLDQVVQHRRILADLRPGPDLGNFRDRYCGIPMIVDTQASALGSE